jgi:hypothetical protein
MARYSDQTITKDVIELNDGEMNYLGHNLILIGCTINIRAKERNVIVSRAEFIDCTIIAKNLKNFNWRRIKMVNCFFAGSFYENNFGNSLIEEQFPTIIKDCDFSHAKIDSTRFYDVDMKTIILPTEPFVTIFEPKKFAQESSKSRHIDKLASFIEFLSPQHDRVKAFTFDSTRVTKKYNLNTEEIQILLEEISLHNQNLLVVSG